MRPVCGTEYTESLNKGYQPSEVLPAFRTLPRSDTCQVPGLWAPASRDAHRLSQQNNIDYTLTGKIFLVPFIKTSVILQVKDAYSRWDAMVCEAQTAL
jgi:hypothetical protein